VPCALLNTVLLSLTACSHAALAEHRTVPESCAEVVPQLMLAL